MAAGGADVMRAFLLAALGAFRMCGRRQGMMRPAHIAPRRRSFSLWNRHGGETPSKSRQTDMLALEKGASHTRKGRAKQAAE